MKGTKMMQALGGDLSECVNSADQHTEAAVKLNARKEPAPEESTTTETHGETTRER
jgi:hypothetical protein